MRAAASPPWRLLGIDFTCAPSPRKPITVARGALQAGALRLERVQSLTTLAAFEALLAEPGPWLAGCDFPFGLPRPFVDALKLGTHPDAVIGEVRRRHPSRLAWREGIDRWGNTQPAGRRLLHRTTDRAGPGISSTSPLQTRYVPVGFMYYEGLHRLVAADVTLPGQRSGDPLRVALEAYPGALAYALVGRRSYKNDDSAERRRARADIVRALEAGAAADGADAADAADAAAGAAPEGARHPHLLSAAQRRQLVADAAGDHLDAVLALVQAAWAVSQPHFGLQPGFDPVEGWIVGARGGRAG